MRDTKEQNRLKYADILESFKTDICANAKTIDSEDEFDWYDLSIGYFLAKGLDIDAAVDLALIARYDEHYWC